MGSGSTTTTPQLTVPNSMSSSYDRDESSDEADDQPVVADHDVAAVAALGASASASSTHDLNNIKRILDQCHVLYKCKVDQHNRKVTSFFITRPVGVLFKF